MGLMAAKIIAARAGHLAGRVKMVFQPAEEGLGGANRMVEEGVLDSPRVDAAVGLHLWNPLPVGTVSVAAGTILAAVDRFVVEILGKGAHAAMPHEGTDAVLAAAHVVTALQGIVARELSPFVPAVVTVARIAGGSAFNVLAGRVELEGTVRTLDRETFETIPVLFERAVQGAALALGARAEIRYERLNPVTVNDARIADLVRDVAIEVAGPEKVEVWKPTMGGEDMSEYLQRVPGCFFFLGSGNAALGRNAPHHSELFDFDERALETGVELLVRVAQKYLSA